MAIKLYILNFNNVKCGVVPVGDGKEVVGEIIRAIPDGYTVDGTRLDKADVGSYVKITDAQLDAFIDATEPKETDD